MTIGAARQRRRWRGGGLPARGGSGVAMGPSLRRRGRLPGWPTRTTRACCWRWRSEPAPATWNSLVSSINWWTSWGSADIEALDAGPAATRGSGETVPGERVLRGTAWMRKRKSADTPELYRFEDGDGMRADHGGYLRNRGSCGGKGAGGGGVVETPRKKRRTSGKKSRKSRRRLWRADRRATPAAVSRKPPAPARGAENAIQRPRCAGGAAGSGAEEKISAATFSAVHERGAGLMRSPVWPSIPLISRAIKPAVAGADRLVAPPGGAACGHQDLAGTACGGVRREHGRADFEETARHARVRRGAGSRCAAGDGAGGRRGQGERWWCW